MAIKPVEILITAKDKASTVFDLLKRNAVSLGATIGAYFGVRAFADAVQGAAELEAKLSEVKSVSGATAAELQLLRKAAESAGATTKFTATEGADALGNLARAGLSAQQAITALPATLALAQAGQLGLAESAEIVTRTIAGFNLQAADSGRIADVLAQGANASNTSVLGLAQALSYAAPTAVSLGLSLETTVAIIGKFADAGIDASRAGTALNAILSQFADPASKFREELAAMGITTSDFESALRQLAAAGPAGQKAVLAVGNEAGPALRALLNQGIGALDDLKGKLDDAAGSAAATAATMENNLLGSMSGLASAWDTVKNALATPVLPVLKDGVDRLAAAFRGAVDNGTVGKFGDAIAVGFQSALTWAQRFIETVDIDALVARVSNAADRTAEAFTTIGDYARNAGAIVQTVWGTMSAGVNGLLVIVYSVGEAFAGVASNIQSGVALILQGLSKITFGQVSRDFEQAAATIRTSAEATWASSEALSQKASEAFQAMADGAQTARNGWAGLTQDTSEAAAQAQASTAAFDSMSQALASVGEAATSSGAQTRDELTKTADTAKATAADVAAAFQRMGIQSKDQLAQAAGNAKRDFDLIKASGQATTDGLRTAFKAYAEAAIAANGGVATDTVRVQAAMQGLEVTTDAAGKTIVRTMAEAAAATAGAGSSANAAAGGYRNMARSAEQAAAAARGLESASGRYNRPEGGSVTGNTRAERLAGQNAVDNSLQFKLREKLDAGTLTDADLADLQNVVAALEQREQIDRDVDRLSAGAFSLEGMRDRQEWQAVRGRFQDAIASMGSTAAPAESAAPASSSRTVRVEINTGRGTEAITTDEAGAQALVRALQAAGLNAGR